MGTRIRLQPDAAPARRPRGPAALKIALLSYEYPPETGFGGIGTYTRTQARALVRLGHEVHVLAGAARPAALHAVDDEGVTVWRLGITRRALRGLDRLRLWWTRNRLENALDMAAGLRRLQREHRFDVVEVPECGAEALLLDGWVDAPIVAKLHSPAALIMPFYDVREADRRLCATLERTALRGVAAFSSGSRFLAAAAPEALGIDAPIEVIPNGVDVEAEAPDGFDLRSRLGVGPERPIVLFSGRMERRKGIHLCPEIVRRVTRLHDCAFVFAGADLFGHLGREVVPASTRGARGSVHALGRLPPEELRACVRQCDVFLMPSLWENCPYACLEAMSAGRAIVASAAGGVPELLSDGENGLLAPPGDAAAHAAAVLRLLDDPALRQRLGAAARVTVAREFDPQARARQSVELYERCRRSH